MINENQIRALIVLKCQELCGCGSRRQEIPIDSAIEVLLGVLNNGRLNSVGNLKTSEMYELAGIKHAVNGDVVNIPDEELDRLGLVANTEGYMRIKDEKFWRY